MLTFAGVFLNTQHVTLYVLLGGESCCRWLFISASTCRKEEKVSGWREPGLNSLWEEVQPSLVRRSGYYVVMRFHAHKSGL